jgi:hypothetical protein
LGCCCHIFEIRRKCEELEAIKNQTCHMKLKWKPYETPTGAGSRAAAAVGAEVGIVYVTVADCASTGNNNQMTCLVERNMMLDCPRSES